MTKTALSSLESDQFGRLSKDGNTDRLRSHCDLALPVYTAESAVSLKRRGSHDHIGGGLRAFNIFIASTKSALLKSEATSRRNQITIEDAGPKVFRVKTANSSDSTIFEIRGTYYLSNLLQELVLAEDKKHIVAEIHEKHIYETSIQRLCRRINDLFWPNLTRRLDASLIAIAAIDPKERSSNPHPRIYVPFERSDQYHYYQGVAKESPILNLDVQLLPEGDITPEFVETLNAKPGILALEMQKSCTSSGPLKQGLRGSSFIVPGGRFNEFYGWDSYFCALGLIKSNKISLVKETVENYVFEIRHYGKILNANRSYYLSRSQPPFLTDLAVRTYEHIQHESNSKEFLRLAILAAIKEYHSVWMMSPRYDPETELSRYGPPGVGFSPEVEEGHFDYFIESYLEKYGMRKAEFVEAYNKGQLKEPQLDEFLRHDRAVRESGHDTSYRLQNVAADLATIDLNALLYKYERDISWAIRSIFDDRLQIPAPFRTTNQPSIENSSSWDRRARRRQKQINRYLWNLTKGMYFDYNTVSRTQSTFESATTFYALWSGVASPAQALALVANVLPALENIGGLSSTSCASVADARLNEPDAPAKQWDYPYGWAPHQILAWDGLHRYGFEAEAQRLAYRWLHMIAETAVNYNGAVVEKYDVTRLRGAHRVDAEYGNQGAEFDGLAREGFGWTNASYQYGLTFLNTHMKRALEVGASWELFAKAARIGDTLDGHADRSSQEF